MIDTLETHRANAAARNVKQVVSANRAVELPPLVVELAGPEGFGALTLHRPSNVDDPAILGRTLALIEEFAARRRWCSGTSAHCRAL